MTERMSKVIGDENRGETGMLNVRLESARFLLPIKALVICVHSASYLAALCSLVFISEGQGWLPTSGWLLVPPPRSLCSCCTVGLWNGCAQGPTWLWGTWGSTISVLRLHVYICRRMRITTLAFRRLFKDSASQYT